MDYPGMAWLKERLLQVPYRNVIKSKKQARYYPQIQAIPDLMDRPVILTFSVFKQTAGSRYEYA